MPRQLAPVEVSNFVGGLITDASPLTFPDNASIAEDNFILNTDGSRSRRLGMDVEDSHQIINTTIDYSLEYVPAHSSYKWDNAGDDPDKSLLVVQFGNEVKFFNLDNSAISSEVLHTELFDSSVKSTVFSYAVVDGLLVIATGLKELTIFEYDGDTTITPTTDHLLIRDLFGLEDKVIISEEEFDLKSNNFITKRPTVKTDAHIYNLRNQTFAVERMNANSESNEDPIHAFFTETSKYPSNADTVNQSLYADPGDDGNRTAERFFATDLESNPLGTSQAPIGHYIIDAMERGAARQAAIEESQSEASSGNYIDLVDPLPLDVTPGGPSVITQFAGRIWYGGFSGEVENGDDKSPRMSSYILFSQQVEDITDIVNCYQSGDPTSKDNFDLVDTDGGFIRLDEAYGIQSMVNLDNTLFVLASNGVWRVVGDDSQTGFKATGYSVIKVNDRGVRGKRSVIQVDGSLVYWSDDGIYSIAKNQFGDWGSSSLIEGKLETLFAEISTEHKELVQGYYDTYDKKARWIYQNDISASTDVRELVMDKALGAFYTNTIKTPTGRYPKVVGIFETNPYQLSSGTEAVTVGGETVTAGGPTVTVTTSGTAVKTTTSRETGYIAVTSLAGMISYTFARYKNSNFYDWVTQDTVGVDAYAYMITGYLSGGDFQRDKDIPYLTTYMRKTEDGFVLDGNGDLTPNNPSSLKVRVQWDWTNSVNSNRWGRQRQFYRHRRLYLPADITDGFDDGNTVVKARDKIRGSGHVLSLMFETEPSKDCHLYGWSLIVGVESNV